MMSAGTSKRGWRAWAAPALLLGAMLAFGALEHTSAQERDRSTQQDEDGETSDRGSEAREAQGASSSDEQVPRRRRKKRDKSAHAGITSNMPCNTCHTPDSWAMGGVVQGGAGFDHARTGFPLTGEHANTPCTGCHQPNKTVVRDCMGCHLDPHQRRLGTSCDRCHNAIAWQDTQTLALHRETRFPLTGMHVLADCSQCHKERQRGQFSSLPVACFSCHKNDYDNAIPNHNTFPTECTLCHRPSGWRPAANLGIAGALTAQSFMSQPAPVTHEMRFPIRSGKHAGAECTTCHISPQVPQAVSCTTCHEHNVMRLRLEHRGTALIVSTTSCLGCHPGGAAR